jgi:hypothetical protein
MRRRGAIVCTIITFVAAVFIVSTHTSSPWRLLIILPAFCAAVGWIQAQMHFCAAFGMMGVFNVAHSAGKVTDVAVAEFAAADRQKSLQIIGYGVLIGVAVTIASVTL